MRVANLCAIFAVIVSLFSVFVSFEAWKSANAARYERAQQKAPGTPLKDEKNRGFWA